MRISDAPNSTNSSSPAFPNRVNTDRMCGDAAQVRSMFSGTPDFECSEQIR